MSMIDKANQSEENDLGESKEPHSQCQESHKNSNLNNHKVYTEGLSQISIDFLNITSISVIPNVSCLVDSLSHVLLMSSTPLMPTVLPPTLPVGLPIPMQGLTVDICFCSPLTILDCSRIPLGIISLILSVYLSSQLSSKLISQLCLDLPWVSESSCFPCLDIQVLSGMGSFLCLGPHVKPLIAWLLPETLNHHCPSIS